MKDKDPNDDELNQDEQDNINEADDSFGLPDLDFNALDEESTEDEPENTETESEESTEDEPENTEIKSEEATEESTVEYSEPDEDVDDADDEFSSADTEDEVAAEKSSYVPPKPESNAPKIIAFLVIVILASAGIWYFGFYRPQAAAAEEARIEAEAQKALAAEQAAALKKQEEERLATEQVNNEAADDDELASDEATFTTISERTGRYYIVIESFVDSDMAADYGKELAGKGMSTALLSPQGKRKFHRLTVGDFGSFVEAQEDANKLKAEFGDDLWVLKY